MAIENLPQLEERIRSSLITLDGQSDDACPIDPSPLGGDFGLRPGGRRPNFAEVTQTPAAVLLPLVTHAEGLTILLTRRTERLRTHAGQVAFPGGRKEPRDRDLAETALRETEEEIGLDRKWIALAGRLDRYQTVTGFLVTPFVGFVKAGFSLRIDPREVAETFEIPFTLITARRNFEIRSLIYEGQEREFYCLEHGGQVIWGATAGMLLNLCLRINRSTTPNN